MVHSSYYEVEADSHIELGRKLGNVFGELIYDDIAEMRRQKKWKRKVTASERFLAETSHYFPSYIEELEAYAKFVGLPLVELWALSMEDELDDAIREKCTTVVTNDGKLISHNEDWDEYSAESIHILKKSLSDLTLFEIYYSAVPLGGCAISINSHGYVQAINSLAHHDRQLGVPRTVIARWLSETKDAEADFERLKQIPRSSGYNHVLVNADGQVFNIECTAARQIMTRPSLPYAHTNHYLSSEFGELDKAKKGDSTFKRHEKACHMMKSQMSVDEVFALNSDQSEGKRKSLFNRNTIGRATIDLENQTVKIWLRREKRLGWLSYKLDFLDGFLNPALTDPADPSS